MTKTEMAKEIAKLEKKIKKLEKKLVEYENECCNCDKQTTLYPHDSVVYKWSYTRPTM